MQTNKSNCRFFQPSYLCPSYGLLFMALLFLKSHRIFRPYRCRAFCRWTTVILGFLLLCEENKSGKLKLLLRNHRP